MSLFDKHPFPWTQGESGRWNDTNGKMVELPIDGFYTRSSDYDLVIRCIVACKGKPEVVERLIAEYGRLNFHDRCDCECCAIYRELEGKK